MRIDAYVTRGLPGLNSFVEKLEAVLSGLAGAPRSTVVYSILEAKSEAAREAARAAGLVEQPFGETSDADEKAAVTKGFMGLVFRYGDQQAVIKFLPPDRTDGLEFWIASKIREIRDENDDIHHKIGLLTGHDEIKISENDLVPIGMGKFSMQGIITQNYRFYTFQDVDLAGGDAAIPDELEGLIITQPGKDLTEKELRRIDQFVMKGKSLAVFASAVNIKAGDATMNATLSLHGLDALLDGYGISIDKDVVLDLDRHVRLIIPTAGGTARVDLQAVLDVQDDPRFSGDALLIDTAFPPLFRVQDLAVPLASSLTIEPDKQPGNAIKVVMRSSPESVWLTGETVDLEPFQRWRSKLKDLQRQKKQFALAAGIQGTLKTAFPGGEKRGVDAPAQSTKPARVFVLASSQFLANPLARAGAEPEMSQHGATTSNPADHQHLLVLAGPYAQQFITSSILVLKGTLDWIVEEDGMDECAAAPD